MRKSNPASGQSEISHNLYNLGNAYQRINKYEIYHLMDNYNKAVEVAQENLLLKEAKSSVSTIDLMGKMHKSKLEYKKSMNGSKKQYKTRPPVKN